MENRINIFDTQEILEKLNKEEKRQRQKDINDLRRIIKTPEGRRWIWRVLEDCGIYRNSFHLNSNQTAFCEGKRDVGLGIIRDLFEADSTTFMQMHNEYIAALKQKEAEREEQNND